MCPHLPRSRETVGGEEVRPHRWQDQETGRPGWSLSTRPPLLRVTRTWKGEVQREV